MERNSKCIFSNERKFNRKTTVLSGVAMVAYQLLAKNYERNSLSSLTLVHFCGEFQTRYLCEIEEFHR